MDATRCMSRRRASARGAIIEYGSRARARRGRRPSGPETTYCGRGDCVLCVCVAMHGVAFREMNGAHVKLKWRNACTTPHP